MAFVHQSLSSGPPLQKIVDVLDAKRYRISGLPYSGTKKSAPLQTAAQRVGLEQ
jgi:hypothetical protein